MSKRNGRKHYDNERVKEALRNLREELRNAEIGPSPYDAAQDIEWAYDPEIAELQFHKYIEDGILITEFGSGLYVFVDTGECHCGRHATVTTLFPPDLRPLSLTISRDDVFQRVTKTFNLNHFKFIDNSKINEDLEEFEREASPEDKVRAQHYADSRLRKHIN